MDTERNRARAIAQAPQSNIKELKQATREEVPSIRLSPEQIEEIHVDEYTLTLFYATRVEPLTVLEMKRQFAEPESKKVQSVMDRFLRAGLVHITPDGKYYSNYPENYVNYADYRYDADLEARKDAKVFELMKEYTGKTDYWKERAYFSQDAFFSEKQTDELLKMFKEIKVKAKEYANENAKKKSIKGLRFRRLKFYDMAFSILFAFVCVLGTIDTAKAEGGGGNDPTLMAFALDQGFDDAVLGQQGGNDPTMILESELKDLDGVVALLSEFQAGRWNKFLSSPPYSSETDYSRVDVSQIKENIREKVDLGGGGHDPTGDLGGGGHDPGKRRARCYVVNSKRAVMYELDENTCHAYRIAKQLAECNRSNQDCSQLERELLKLTLSTEL